MKNDEVTAVTHQLFTVRIAVDIPYTVWIHRKVSRITYIELGANLFAICATRNHPHQ